MCRAMRRGRVRAVKRGERNATPERGGTAASVGRTSDSLEDEHEEVGVETRELGER